MAVRNIQYGLTSVTAKILAICYHNCYQIEVNKEKFLITVFKILPRKRILYIYTLSRILPLIYFCK